MNAEAGARMMAVRDKFIARCREERAQLAAPEQLDERNFGRIGEAAHKIAGLAGTLGFSSLGEAAAQVDRHIANHDDLEPAYRLYIAELDRLLAI
ncbi:MAG TPA: Hpt domain-containing protein [Sphingobium sp.]|nr:Hpt domain-containing protein [Sphingobium sp.]